MVAWLRVVTMSTQIILLLTLVRDLCIVVSWLLFAFKNTNRQLRGKNQVVTLHGTCRVHERRCISSVNGGKQRQQGLMVKCWDTVLRANQVHKCVRNEVQSRRETWDETNTELRWSPSSLGNFSVKAQILLQPVNIDGSVLIIIIKLSLLLPISVLLPFS